MHLDIQQQKSRSTTPMKLNQISAPLGTVVYVHYRANPNLIYTVVLSIKNYVQPHPWSKIEFVYLFGTTMHVMIVLIQISHAPLYSALKITPNDTHQDNLFFCISRYHGHNSHVKHPWSKNEFLAHLRNWSAIL